MSSKVKPDNTIILTRGDTLRLKIKIIIKENEQDPGTPYYPVEGEKVRFAVKHNIYVGSGYTELKDPEPLINKQVPIDTLVLQLDPEDTKDLAFGTYLYDVELTKLNGDVDTFITEEKFKLTTEVH